MLQTFKNGQGSIVLRAKLLDSSSTTGAGLAGLTSASTGLIVGTIVDNEATSTAYTVAGSTIETITTLGTYAAPTATKCRFKEVDATNHKGLYEFQFADARFAVASAKSILISVAGATNLQQADFLVQLTSIDPYDSVRGGMTALPNAAAAAIGGLMTAPTVANIGSNVSGYELGAVWFDTGGAAGAVSYVNGIPHNPCSSPTNTKTLLTNLNLKVVRVVNASSYTAEATYTGYSFIGEKWTFAPASQSMINCYFKGATITSGTFNAASTGCQFDQCHLNTVTMPAGATATSATTFYQCGLNGTFTVNAAGIYNFSSCFEEAAAGGEFTVDFAAVGATTVHMDSFTGLLTVANMAAGDVLQMSGYGRLTIAASCTAGTIFIEGNIVLVNNGSGQTINDTSRWNEDQTIAAVTTVNGLAANVITAAATAADFTTEVTAGLAQEATLTTVAGYVDTEVAAIKAKTDLIPASPAAVGSAMTLTSAYDFAKGTVAMTEGYAADGVDATPSQMLYMLWSLMAEKSIASTTLTAKKLDGTTSAMTFTLSDATSPVSITRAT